MSDTNRGGSLETVRYTNNLYNRKGPSWFVEVGRARLVVSSGGPTQWRVPTKCWLDRHVTPSSPSFPVTHRVQWNSRTCLSTSDRVDMGRSRVGSKEREEHPREKLDSIIGLGSLQSCSRSRSRHSTLDVCINLITRRMYGT